jgi:hypothetical protein
MLLTKGLITYLQLWATDPTANPEFLEVDNPGQNVIPVCPSDIKFTGTTAVPRPLTIPETKELFSSSREPLRSPSTRFSRTRSVTDPHDLGHTETTLLFWGFDRSIGDLSTILDGMSLLLTYKAGGIDISVSYSPRASLLRTLPVF